MVLGAMGAEMVAVVVMVLKVEVRSGDGEEEGEDWGITELKQASSELPGILVSNVVKSKRSRPEDAAALVLPSEGAKGSLGGRGLRGEIQDKQEWGKNITQWL